MDDYQSHNTICIATSTTTNYIPSKQNFRTMIRHGLVLVVFICLTVVLLRHEIDNIPALDLRVSQGFFIAVLLFVFGSHVVDYTMFHWNRNHKVHSFTTGMESNNKLPIESQLILNKLMVHEVAWTLLLPWLILLTQNQGSSLAGYILTPHLYFFQVQILLETILQLSRQFTTYQPHAYQRYLWTYTVLANIYRGIPIVTTLLRSWVLITDAWQGTANIVLSTTLLLQPILTTGLWCYSTFVFVPFIWYPTLNQK